MIYCIYRISDGSQPKTKISHADKFYCLDNFSKVFKDSRLIILADNCKKETVDRLHHYTSEIHETSLGNAASWRYAFELGIRNGDDNDIVYLVEDDYLHLPDAAKCLIEGLDISDYVSLYDHPDKYINFKDGGPNKFIDKGGEESIVMLTESTHWKTTNSTTMTFAARVKTLREDKDIWWKYTEKWPLDYMAFWELTGVMANDADVKKKSTWHLFFKKFRNRKLLSPIPGRATHTELKWLSPLTDWSDV